MAEERPSTPERELLKLIEEPSQTAKVSPVKAQFKLLALFSPVVWKARISLVKTKFKGGIHLKELIYHLEFRIVNRVLEIAIFFLLFYLVSNFIFSLSISNKRSNLEFKIKEIGKQVDIPESSLLKVSSFYLEKARVRDLFKMGLPSVAEVEGQSAAPTFISISDRSKSLKLVGISWSDDPDVMIENTKENRTYFLKRGQMIDDFKIKAIFKDKVILSYRGEEIELK